MKQEVEYCCYVRIVLRGILSLKREGSSKAVIEAITCEILPIVTNSGGSPGLVEEGKSSLIVPPRNPEAIANAIYVSMQWL